MNKNINKLIEYPKEGILSKEVYKDDKLEITLFCMASGTKIGEHTSSKKALVHVIEGDGKFRLGNKNVEMNPGVLINMKKNESHGLEADKNTSFILCLY